MKKKFLFLIMFFLTSFLCGFAQEMRDVVYLKDGSVVKGIIVEQIPNKSIKLQTGDGSLFVYSMDAVEKMTKELREASPRRFAGKGLTAGYKGYVDFGYTLGAGSYALDRCAVSIVNGVQFNPYLYAGVGVGLIYYTKNYEIGIPVFANVRGYFVKGNVAPFLDLRVGYRPLVDATGYYLSPSFGCRFGLAERVGLNLSVGYEMQEATLYFNKYDISRYYSTFIGGISFKLALDF